MKKEKEKVMSKMMEQGEKNCSRCKNPLKARLSLKEKDDEDEEDNKGVFEEQGDY